MRLQVQLQEAQTSSKREEGWEGPNQSPAHSGRAHTLIGQRGLGDTPSVQGLADWEANAVMEDAERGREGLHNEDEV